MKRLSFLPALLFALGLAIMGSLLGYSLAPLFGVARLAPLLCAALSLAYVLFLLARSDVRRGRISLLAAWLCAALLIAWLCSSLLSVVAAHLILIWLTRALLFHASALTALADLAVSALSLAAGCWAAAATGSLFASLWSIGLLQASCALLPTRIGKSTSISANAHQQRFSNAARAAEQALVQLGTGP